MESLLLKVGTGALLLALLLALYSFVVYFFRLGFLSIAVSHAVLTGLAFGVFLGVNPTLSALLFSLAVGWFIAFLKRKTGLTEDASIGLVLAVSMAVGIILLYLSGYQGNAFAYLFGSLMTLSWGDAAALFVLGALSVVLLLRFKEQILFLCFDEESAYASGVNADLLYYTLVGFLSFLITFATKLVGILLTHAMLVLPVAAAYQVVWHYPKLIALSGAVSLTSTFGGLALAYLMDLPAGPSVVVVGGVVFFVLYLLGRVVLPLLRRGGD